MPTPAVAGMLAGGLFNIHLRGTGLVALGSDGEPVKLDVGSAPTFADPQAANAWSGGVSTSLKTEVQAKSLVGMGLGRELPARPLGPGLGLGAALRGSADPAARIGDARARLGGPQCLEAS
jgi:uncharacterized protein (AIM24 family)